MQFLQSIFPNLTINRLARWAAIAGALALLGALVAYMVEEELSSLVFGLLVVGVGGLGAWFLIAPDELRDWLTGRQAYYGTGTVVLIVIVIGAATVGYSLAQDQNVVIDITENALFTISETSRDIVQQLDNRLDNTGLEARIIGFYAREDLRDQQSADFMIRQFVNESNGVLTREYYDPDVRPTLAAQFGYGRSFSASGQLSGPLYLAIYTVDGEMVTFEEIGGPQERNIANAMLRIVVAGQFKMYFVSGHDEYAPDDTTVIGLSAVYEALPRLGINVDILNLEQVAVVPDDATAIVIAGAQVDLSQAEVDKLAAYMNQGGRLLVTADPPFIDEKDPTRGTNVALLEDSPLNDYLWNEFGMRFREDIIWDPVSSIENELSLVADRFNPSSEIVSSVQGLPIIFLLARSIEVSEQVEPDTNQGLYRQEVLLLSSDESYGEQSLLDFKSSSVSRNDEEDVDGPLVLAAAAQRRDELNADTQPRVVLVGDTDWATNFMIDPPDGTAGREGNIRLWGNIVEWLTQYSEIATLGAQNRTDLLPLVTTQQEQRRIQLVTLVFLPGMVLGAGLIVWGLRRRH